MEKIGNIIFRLGELMTRRIQIGSFAWPPPAEVHIHADSKSPTVNTHYNPALWTALWNEQYFKSRSGSAREQLIHVLNLRADPATHVRQDTIERVHRDRKLGLAKLVPEELVRWAPRCFPPGPSRDAAINEFQTLGPTVLDNENFYCQIEGLPAYAAVMEAIDNEAIRTRKQKRWICVFLLACKFRHPLQINQVIQVCAKEDIPRWVAMLELRKLFGNHEWVFRNIAPIENMQWILHIASRHTFPLPDYAVLSNRSGSRVWAALSPRMLLEIVIGRETAAICTTSAADAASDRSLLENYRRLAIGHATREIIFNDDKVLEAWRDTPEFCDRFQELKEVDRKRKGTEADR